MAFSGDDRKILEEVRKFARRFKVGGDTSRALNTEKFGKFADAYLCLAEAFKHDNDVRISLIPLPDAEGTNGAICVEAEDFFTLKPELLAHAVRLSDALMVDYMDNGNARLGFGFEYLVVETDRK